MKPEVRLFSRGKFDFTVPLGGGPAVLSGGSPNWEEVARSNRVAMTDYRGQTLIRVDVPVLLDGWPHDSVEDEVEQILKLCRGREGQRPPDFTASGPIPYSGTRFVMELPEWGDGLRSAPFRGRGGELVRQELTLKLLQFIDPDTVRFRRINRMGVGKGKPVQTTVLHDGETLLRVSTRMYGNPNRAGEIGKLNGINDTRRKLQAGRRLSLPR
jgi:hypothetical protein